MRRVRNTLASSVLLLVLPVAAAGRLIPDGDSFVIATTRSGYGHAGVAMDPLGRFVVVWDDDVDGFIRIRGQRFREDAARRGGGFEVASSLLADPSRPAVASATDGDFVVVWSERGTGPCGPSLQPSSIRARQLTDAGNAFGGTITVAEACAENGPTSAGVAREPSGGFVVVWTDHAGADADAIGRRFSRRATAVGDAFEVTQVADFAADLSARASSRNDGDFVAAWLEPSAQVEGDLDVVARRCAAACEAEPTRVLVGALSPGQSRATIGLAANADDSFVAAWSRPRRRDARIVLVDVSSADVASAPYVVASGPTGGAPGDLEPAIATTPNGARAILVWREQDADLVPRVVGRLLCRDSDANGVCDVPATSITTTSTTSTTTTTTGTTTTTLAFGCGDDALCVFTTFAALPADLGGLAGADQTCDTAAAAIPALRGRRFGAWLSGPTRGPATRFSISATARYERFDGVMVADGFADLVDGSLPVSLSVTERGTLLFGDGAATRVWTNTALDGVPANRRDRPSLDSCDVWTNDSAGGGTTGARSGLVGSATAVSSPSWTDDRTVTCDSRAHLYCIEQAPYCGSVVSGDPEPRVADCLGVLRATVGLLGCLPRCVCDVDGSGSISVTDALTCLGLTTGMPGAAASCPDPCTATAAPVAATVDRRSALRGLSVSRAGR